MSESPYRTLMDFTFRHNGTTTFLILGKLSAEAKEALAGLVNEEGQLLEYELTVNIWEKRLVTKQFTKFHQAMFAFHKAIDKIVQSTIQGVDLDV